MSSTLLKSLLVLVLANISRCHANPSYQGNNDGFGLPEGGDWQFFNGLGDLPEGNLDGTTGFYNPHSSFSNTDDDYGHLIEALPHLSMQQDNTGSSSSNTQFNDHDPNDPWLNPSRGYQRFDQAQSDKMQHPNQSSISASVEESSSSFRRVRRPYKPRRKEIVDIVELEAPPSIRSSKILAREKFLAHQKAKAERVAQESQVDEALMCAWGVFKVLMNLPDANVDPKDTLWLKFIKNQTLEIINDLNSGDLQKTRRARSPFSKHFIFNLRTAILDLPSFAFVDECNLLMSEWAMQNSHDGGQVLDFLLKRIFEMIEVPANVQVKSVMQTFWRRRLLTRSNLANIDALMSGSAKRQHWALADLANLSL